MSRFVDTVEGRLAYDFFNTVGSAYAAHLADLCLRGDLVGLLAVPMPDPVKYQDHRAFGEDYAAWSFLRKADFLDIGVDKAGAALRSFLDAEKDCAFYNRTGVGRHWYSFEGPPRPTGFDQTFGAVFHTAKVKIGRLLGVFSWNKVERLFGFSGGASTRLSRRAGSPFYKLQGKPEVTRQAALLSVCAIECRAGWKKARGLDLFSYEDWVTVVKGSHSTTVPKNARTDRFICKEPDMNMFMQRGFGGFIRKRLKTVGVDLDDQSINQRLALAGSADGSLATIDLKAASDSISLELVRALLPGDWFEALMTVRSEYTLLKEKDFPNLRSVLGRRRGKSDASSEWVRLEKISSMGNGFTFELESLIFWALTSSVVELSGCPDTRIGIYGDDIICPSSVAARVIDVLAYSGFATNIEKTFIHGPFRESCGFHGFLGRDVSPFCVTKRISGRNRVNWFLNTVNLWVGRLGVASQKWLRYLRRATKVLMADQKITWFNHVPESEGLEAGIIQPLHLARTVFSFKRSGYRFVSFRASRSRHRVHGPFGVIYALSGRPDRGVPSWEDYLFGDDLSYEDLPTGDTRYNHVRGWTSSWSCTSAAFGMTVRGFFFAPAA